MIENKFLYFQTYADFTQKLNDGVIDRGSVVFIEDESIIWTHGNEFICTQRVPISDQFGDGTEVTVSQKALTDAVNSIWNKIEDMTGESLHGINMVVSPSYYVGDDGHDITISADSSDAASIFENIKFYINDELIAEFENVDVVELFQAHIEDTSIVKCEAKILGTTYTNRKKIVRYPGFWLGAGTSYTDVMNEQHLVDITGGIRTDKDITFRNNDYLFVIMSNAVLDDFIRVDMNGFEMPLEDGVPIPDEDCTYFKSKSRFQAGTYNIDING